MYHLAPSTTGHNWRVPAGTNHDRHVLCGQTRSAFLSEAPCCTPASLTSAELLLQSTLAASALSSELEVACIENREREERESVKFSISE